MTHRIRHKDHDHGSVEEVRACHFAPAVQVPKERPRYITLTSILVDGEYREATHQTPCVCGPYDLCHEFRLAKAQHAGTRNGYIREMFRAYND